MSFIIPIYNGEERFRAALEAILDQRFDGPLEVLVVDDKSHDRSREIVEHHAGDERIRLIDGEGRGAAAAINLGIREATHPIICQVDQDVVIGPAWTARLVGALEGRDEVAGVQGCFCAGPGGSVWERVMALDLSQRYGRIKGDFVDHVCTGNTAYRAAAMKAVGGLDESFGYGYDNDLSYRLGREGYRLRFCREATSLHHWPSGPRGYWAQQYGVGYGRLDLVAKHPRRVWGDQVSGPGMILHAAGMALVAGALAVGAILAAMDLQWRALIAAGLCIAAALAGERLVAGALVAWRRRDPAGLFFPVAHLLRDLAWVTAIIVWTARRLAGRHRQPGHSMPRSDPGEAEAVHASEEARG